MQVPAITAAGVTAAETPPIPAPGPREQNAAQKFEELLATQLVREMRRALPEGLFGEGAGSDVFEGWFDEHMGRSISAGGALGLADALMRAFGSADVSAELDQAIEVTQWRTRTHS